MKEFSDEGFYLAGGTGLALLIGHRDSVDFDFFKKDNFNNDELIEKLRVVFRDHEFKLIMKKKNTVYVEIDDGIELSFFTYNYELLKPLVKTEYFDIASIEDIACMKLSAISGRAAEKDYVDLHFIMKNFEFKNLIESGLKKFPIINETVILKSLASTIDVEEEHIGYKNGNKEVPLEKIRKHFEKEVKNYIRQKQLEVIRNGKDSGKDRGIGR